jgi:S1-C subfamily serine protease
VLSVPYTVHNAHTAYKSRDERVAGTSHFRRLAFARLSGMITSNVIGRVFHLRHGKAVATGVAIDVDDRSYLVTARHFAETIKDPADIGLLHKGAWHAFSVTLVGHGAGEVDISVLATPSVLCPPSAPLPADVGGLTYGQDVYFLGFPYGTYGNVGALNRGLPLPFVKKAIVACMESDPVKKLHLDGHNNFGFSGGPVVFTLPNSINFKLAGIVSGYRYSEEPVYEAGKVGPLTYRENTGLILAYSIQYAVDIARANPIGALHRKP